jgi:ubiquinone biosynthesis protein
MSASEARGIIEKGMGQSIDEVFSEFDDEPLGSASIGQCHAAVLRSHPHVIRSPGLEIPN